MKKLISIIGFLAWTFCVALGFFVAGRVYQEQHPTRDALDLLPSIQQVQQRLGCNKIDGKLCKGWGVKDHSETQTLWDKLYCQQACDKAVAAMLKEQSDE